MSSADGRLHPLTAGCSQPVDSPLYTNGERGWAYRDSFFAGVQYETNRDAFLDLLPLGLKPLHDIPQVFIWAIDCRTAGLGDFYEMKIEMLVEYEGSPHTYCPYIMVSQRDDEGLPPDAAMAVGREMIGAPKKIGRIRWKRDSGQVQATLERPAGSPIVTVSVAPKEQLSPEQLGIADAIPNLYLRVIPNVEGGIPSVAELVRFEIPNRYDPTQTFRGSGMVHFGAPSAEDPWHRLAPERVLHGITAAFALDIPPRGEVVIDYRQRGANLEERGQAADPALAAPPGGASDR